MRTSRSSASSTTRNWASSSSIVVVASCVCAALCSTGLCCSPSALIATQQRVCRAGYVFERSQPFDTQPVRLVICARPHRFAKTQGRTVKRVRGDDVRRLKRPTRGLARGRCDSRDTKLLRYKYDGDPRTARKPTKPSQRRSRDPLRYLRSTSTSTGPRRAPARRSLKRSVKRTRAGSRSRGRRSSGPGPGRG